MRVGNQKQVVGLEVAVHHVASVGRGQGLGHLAAPVDGVVDPHGAPAEHLGQRLTLQVLHHDVGRAAAEDARVVDVHDTGVADGVRGPGLGDEPADDLRVGRVARRQHLDRRAPADATMDREVHLSHPPFSDEALDFVVA